MTSFVKAVSDIIYLQAAIPVLTWAMGGGGGGGGGLGRNWSMLSKFAISRVFWSTIYEKTKINFEVNTGCQISIVLLLTLNGTITR